MKNPLCFVIMPFGQKKDAAGNAIEFNEVYETLIKPAIMAAELEPIRADEELVGGIIHKPMFERLLLCEYAVGDLTLANANVFYELGVRHTMRPHTTLLIFSQQTPLPFDVAPLRALPYSLSKKGKPSNIDADVAAIARRLTEGKASATKAVDSPLFQLLEGIGPPDISRLKTDVFRDRVEYASSVKDQLAEARRKDRASIYEVEQKLGKLGDVEAGVVIDLFLSYRAVKAWPDMARVFRLMDTTLARTTLVREQLGLALNRAGEREKAEKVLIDLVKERGPSSETLGILGRVYKDRRDAAVKAGDAVGAAGFLDKAIDTYRKGFEADWRDAYPGVNAVTLMEIREPPDPTRLTLLPIVQYAVDRRLASGEPDYWDYATGLELAVLAQDEIAATRHLGLALTAVREPFEPETTANNLRIIREARERRGVLVPWAKAVEDRLAAWKRPD